MKIQATQISERTALLWIADDHGQVGIGECSPLAGRSPDTIAQCMTALESLGDQAQAELERAVAHLPAARFALDTALADLDAQVSDCSVSEGIARRARRSHERPTSTVTLDASAVVPIDALPAPGDIAERVSTWKIKLGGGDFERELEQLRDLRPRVAHLRIDVNRQWTLAQARARLPRLAEFKPQWVEEALSAEDLLAVGEQAVPLALDESAFDQPGATGEALERGLVRALVLKPAILGGFVACAKWAQRARDGGAVPVVSHLFDGPVALAACAELALALAVPGDPAAGLGLHRGLAAHPRRVVPQFDTQRGSIGPHPRGLGIRIATDELHR